MTSIISPDTLDLVFDTVLRGWDKEQVRQHVAEIGRQIDAALGAAEAMREASDAFRDRCSALEKDLDEARRELEATKAEIAALREDLDAPGTVPQAAMEPTVPEPVSAPTQRYSDLCVDLAAILNAAEEQAGAVCASAELRALEIRSAVEEEAETARRESDAILLEAKLEADDLIGGALAEVERLEKVQNRLRVGLEATANWVMQCLADGGDKGGVPTPFALRQLPVSSSRLLAG